MRPSGGAYMRAVSPIKDSCPAYFDSWRMSPRMPPPRVAIVQMALSDGSLRPLRDHDSVGSTSASLFGKSKGVSGAHGPR